MNSVAQRNFSSPTSKESQIVNAEKNAKHLLISRLRFVYVTTFLCYNIRMGIGYVTENQTTDK